MFKRLRSFLTLAIGEGEAVITGKRRQLGYQQITLGNSTATALTLPTPPAHSALTSNLALIQNQDTTIYVRWRDDGTDPTTTVGMRLPPGAELDYVGNLA